MEDSQMYSFDIKSVIHDYNVSFIDDFSKTLSDLLREGDVIIIDKNVSNLYHNKLNSILSNTKYIEIDANETQKSYAGLIPIIEELIQSGFRKNNRLIAIGGGITQDITAFTSSIMYRGVNWFFFPTTLLAQGDSCIGSKTSINFGEFKNQLGGFYPPLNIYIDLLFLDTLKHIDIQSGLGEMCHYYIVAGEEDFKRYKREYKTALHDTKILEGIIARSLEIKKSYIEIDEFDQKQRQVFNYGHSFGHAIESLTSYRIPHGIAVSYGMDMANFISVKLGYISNDIRLEIRALLEQIWEGTSIDDISVEKFRIALSKDKKNVGNKLGLILNNGYGKIFKKLIEPDENFKNILTEYFKKT
jgi:3-dehydroquinate synthase